MKRTLLILVGFAVAGAAFAWLHQASNLYVNGKLASGGVIERNGVAYVPIRDLAAGMKMTLAKTSRGYELSDAGGANQLEGVVGKVGDTLWNGYARFTVVKVIRGKEYTNQFSGDSQKITPFPEGNDLVVLVCRIKNGMKKTVTCGLPSGNETALTDTDEHSYGPRTGLSIDCPSRGQTLLPGAAVDFALTFDVSPNAVLKDLVYQLGFYEGGGVNDKKFRVSLQ